MAETRELDRVLGDLDADEHAALGQAELVDRAELVERQVAGGVGGVRHGVGELHPARHGEEEACAEGMRDAQQIAEIHRLRNAVHPDREIAAQTYAPDGTGGDASLSPRDDKGEARALSRPAMSNPILVEVTRDPLVESVHRGAFAVSDAKGGLRLLCRRRRAADLSAVLAEAGAGDAR